MELHIFVSKLKAYAFSEFTSFTIFAYQISDRHQFSTIDGEGFYMFTTAGRDVALGLTGSRREAYIVTCLWEYMIISQILIYGK
jgi:hypothetical protein